MIMLQNGYKFFLCIVMRDSAVPLIERLGLVLHPQTQARTAATRDPSRGLENTCTLGLADSCCTCTSETRSE